jgi:TP901 family phage tail tape measure protein
MADVNANIGVNIDTSEALAQLKALQRQISQFHTSIAKSSESAALAQRDLQKNFLNSVNAIGAFSAELRTVRTTAESFTDSLEKNKFSMREYFRFAGGSTKTFGKLFKSEFDTIGKVAEDRVKRLQTQYIKLGRDTSGAMKAIAIMPNQLDMSNFSTQSQIAAQKQAIFNQLVKQGSTNLLNFGKNTQWAGRQLMVGFTLPLAALGTVATRTFMEMEEATIKFRKVYGDLFTPKAETDAALESITALGQSFTQYGVAVSQTVGLAAEAAAAGFQGVDLQRQTAQATRLSVLGQIEANKALETTISLQNAFKMSSDQLAGSIDFLNAVENQTVVSLDDITTAIPKVAPVIQQLGGDVKDLAFFMAAMKEGGINASEGANALKSGLAALINPTAKASAIIQGYGINIDKIVEGNQGDLKGTVIEFAQALDTLDPLTRARAIEQLFGKFQFARLSTLFDNVTNQTGQAGRVLELAGTSIEDLATLSETELGVTADSAMNKFRKSVEDLKLALVPVGQTFLQAVTPIVEFAGGILEKFNNLSSGVKKALVVLTVAIGAIGPVALMTFGLLANGIANIVKGAMILRNGYLRLTGQSQILGEQTEYLTMEQIDAAAASHSLDQSHARLIQTFTAETGAIGQLITAYQQGTTAAAKFAAINPGMMRAPTPKKFARGGIVEGPGSGTSDSILAMLSNGEAVIPAKVVKQYPGLISSLVSENIPGFKKGTTGVNIERAHATGSFAESSQQFQAALDMVAGLRELNNQFPGMIRVVSNLTAELPSKLNQAMKEVTLRSGKVSGGVGIERFASEYGSFQNKFTASAARGGANIQDPAIEAELLKFEDTVGKRAIEIAKGTKNLKVTDTIFAQATREVIDEFNLMEGNAKKVAIALDTVSKQVGQVRIQPTQAQYREGLASGAFSIDPTGKVARFGSIDVARPKSATKSGLAAARPASNINFPGNYTAGRDLATTATQVTNEAVLATARAAGTQSPSKKTIPIGEDIARGLQVGMANQQDEVSASGQSLGAAAVGGTQSGATRQRRIATRPQGAPQQQQLAPAVSKTTNNLDSMNRALMGGTFALTTLAGAGSMAGGTIGKLSNQVMKYSGLLFGLMSITQLLTQAKIAELVSSRSAKIANLMSPGATGFKSLMAGVTGFGAKLLTAGKFFLRFLGPIGLATSALIGAYSIIKMVNAARERERLAIEGLADAMSTTEAQVKTLGDFFGVIPTKLPFELGQRELVAPKVRTQRETLKADAGFQKEFKTTIEQLRKATNEEAKLVFSSLALNLQAQGFAKDQVQVIIDALREESSQTDVTLDVKSLNLSQESLDQIKKDVAPLLLKLNKELNTGMTTKFVGGQFGAPITEIVELSKGAQKELETTATFITETAKSASGMFQLALIDGKTYEATLNTILQVTNGLDEAQRKLLLSKVFEQLGVAANKYTDALFTARQEMQLLALLSSGVLSKDSPILKALASTDYKTQMRGVNGLNKLYDQMFSRLEKIGEQERKNNNTTTTTIDNTKKLKDKAEELFGFLERAAQREYKPKIINAEKEVKNAQDAVDKIQDKIDAIQSDIDVQQRELETQISRKIEDYQEEVNDLQRTIEMEFDRPIQEIQKEISALERGIELDFGRPLEALQETSSDLSNELTLLDRAADAINKKYDAQEEALNKVADANQRLIDQDKQRISLADALTKGDISAAAAAIQDMRKSSAAAAVGSRSDLLKEKRQAELDKQRTASGLTRKQIEEAQFIISQKIFAIEEKREAVQAIIQTKQDAIFEIEKSREATLTKIKKIEDDIYDLQEEREAKLIDIRDLEDKIYNIRIKELDPATKSLEAAKNKLQTLQDELQARLDNVELQRDAFEAEADAAIAREVAQGKYNDVLTKTLGLLQQIASLNGQIEKGAAGYNAKLPKITDESEALDEFISIVEKLDAAQLAYDEAVASGNMYKVRNTGIALTAAQKAYDATLPKIDPNSVGGGGGRNFLTLSSGGMVKPKYFSVGGQARGTDIVPAMLTPGEFVMSKYAVNSYGTDKMKAINSGTYEGEKVYNYNLSVNVKSDSNPDDIARVVIKQIQQLDNQRIRKQAN